MENKVKTKVMFVYGSLKEGFLNHQLIEEITSNKKLGTGFVRGYKLYSLYVTPAIKPSDIEDRVFVEKYALTEPCFNRIDRMEQKAGYSPVVVVDNDGVKGTIYVYNLAVKNEKHIPRGVWTKDCEKIIVEEPKDEGEVSKD